MCSVSVCIAQANVETHDRSETNGLVFVLVCVSIDVCVRVYDICYVDVLSLYV